MRAAVLLLWASCLYTIFRAVLCLVLTASPLRRLLVLAVAALLVFALSLWQRTGARTYFLAMLVFILPLVLQLLGLSWAERFSLYPLYSWMRSM